MFAITQNITQKLRTINSIKGNIFMKKFNHLLLSKLRYQSLCSSVSTISRKIEFDYDYLCDRCNTDIIRENIIKRKSNGDIDKVISLWETLKQGKYNQSEKQFIENELYFESLKIPNKSSSHLYKYGETPFLLGTYNEKPTFKFKPKEFHIFAQGLHILTMDNYLHQFTGSKTYAFNSSLANLERALIRYCITSLINKGFTLISVPDLLYSHVIERCGMHTKGKRSQVYRLTNFGDKDVCLSGTAEMAIGGYLQDKELHIRDLPMKIAAVSRCYRQEVGRTSTDKGIFRVHQFNKVEMFGVTANETGDESRELYDELIKIQSELYAALDMHLQVLDMPINDLGDPAHTKTDIEAWIPVKQMFGEITSTSNCLDYQSRRLNIRYKNENGDVKFAHTVNGTACATPRVLISLVAGNQKSNGTISVPKALQPFFGQEVIQITKHPHMVTRIKGKTYTGTILKATEELEADFN